VELVASVAADSACEVGPPNMPTASMPASTARRIQRVRILSSIWNTSSN
jgi:hypothetical protein